MKTSKPTPRSTSARSAFTLARDVLFAEILRCKVPDCDDTQVKQEWFDDAMGYIADRFVSLSPTRLAELRKMGEEFALPVLAFGCQRVRSPEGGNSPVKG